MSNEQYTTNLRVSAATMGIVAMCLQDFSAQIIWHVHNGGKLDDEAFSTIKGTCIQNLKNTAGRGMPLEQEADALNSALSVLAVMMATAISNGRDLKY